MIVGGSVVDNRPYTQGRSGVRASCEFASQPPYGIGLELLVAGVVPPPIGGYDFGEIIAPGELLENGKPLADDDFGSYATLASGAKAISDETFDDGRHCSSVWTSSGRQVTHQFRI
jgi:hypothetical protein